MTCPFQSAPNDLAKENDPALDYDNYLQLDKILNANSPKSGKNAAKWAHTEHLFITIHQVFELWFKQCIHDLRAVITTFRGDHLADEDILFVHNGLKRISTIINNGLEKNFVTLETMSAMEFLEFRSYLGTASGFQSWQFRVFENLIGLKPEWRTRYSRRDYKEFLREEHARVVTASEEETDLLTVVCDWLARCPYLDQDWNFWDEFQAVVLEIIEEKRAEIENNEYFSNEEKRRQFKDLEEGWSAILSRDEYEKVRGRGVVKMTYEALQGAIFIEQYRNHHALQMPYKILESIMDIETALRGFRIRHANMVHRMIGSKVGTGGSSGYNYLRATEKRHSVFADLFNISSYLLPPERLPELPKSITSMLSVKPATPRKKSGTSI